MRVQAQKNPQAAESTGQSKSQAEPRAGVRNVEGVHPGGNADLSNNKGLTGKAIRKTMKTKGRQKCGLANKVRCVVHLRGCLSGVERYGLVDREGQTEQRSSPASAKKMQCAAFQANIPDWQHKTTEQRNSSDAGGRSS